MCMRAAEVRNLVGQMFWSLSFRVPRVLFCLRGERATRVVVCAGLFVHLSNFPKSTKRKCTKQEIENE